MERKVLRERSSEAYQHAQLEDLIGELIKHKDHVKGTVAELRLLQKDKEKSAKHPRSGENAAKPVDKYVDLLNGMSLDLARVIDELPFGVRAKHFRILREVLDTANEEIEKSDISQLLDERAAKRNEKGTIKRTSEADGQFLAAIQSLLVLKDINNRLKSFYGYKLRQENGRKKPALSSDAADLEVPSGTKWENLRLEFQDIGEIRIRLNYRSFGVKNYRALGFENKAAVGESAVSGKPNRLWRTLALFASRDGNVNWENVDSGEVENLVKHVSELRKHLRGVFRIAGSPITRYVKGRRQAEDSREAGYSTVFEIAPIDEDLFQRIVSWVGGGRIYPATIVQRADIDEDEIS